MVYGGMTIPYRLNHIIPVCLFVYLSIYLSIYLFIHSVSLVIDRPPEVHHLLSRLRGQKTSGHRAREDHRCVE